MFRCALCAGTNAQELLRIKQPDRFERSIGVEVYGYTRCWVECQQCGGATNVLPEESAQRLAALRAAYYEVDFMDSDIGEKYRRVMSMPAGESDNAGRVARVVKFVSRWSGVPVRPKVMDIGAGTGVFLSLLVDQTNGAWQYLGIEPDPRAATHLRQLEKFEVVEAMYLGQPELREFNLITLNKVLEHIEEPLPFLLQVVQSLVPDDGLLYVEVPDKLTSRLRSPADNILGALHCHLYDPASLGYLLRRAGLELLCVNRIAEPSGKLSIYAFAAPSESIKGKDCPMSDQGITIIAEIGSVHDGSIGNALKAIEAAATCGADVVKFQTHIAEAETLADAPMPPYFKGEPRMDYFRRTAFNLLQWKQIAQHSVDHGVRFLSSSFSLEGVDLLEEVGVECYKIPSGEVNNVPLLERVAATGKRVYLSSGMSNWAELDQAVAVLRKGGPLVVMQCSSAYPCKPERVGLNVMLEMQQRYGLPVGLSDHTLGYAACISAVALGATVVEKHFTFSRLMYGSDALHSMEPDEFKAFCSHVKEAAIIRANPVDKDDLRDYLDMKRIFEKSVVAAHAIQMGQTLKATDLAFKKPGDGIPAARYTELLGRQVRHTLSPDQKITWGDLA